MNLWDGFVGEWESFGSATIHHVNQRCASADEMAEQNDDDNDE